MSHLLDAVREFTDPIGRAPDPRWRRGVSMLLALGLVLLGGAWIGAPWDWRIDLVANLSAQFMPIPVIAGGWWAFRRRWGPFVLAAAAVALHTAVLVPGRAPRARADPCVRVLVYNPNCQDTHREEAIDAVLASGADVVALVETPLNMVIAAGDGGRLRTAFPYAVHRGAGPGRDNSHHALLSRWPISRIDGIPMEAGFDGPIEVVAETPGGPLGIVVAQPHSPRTADRWMRGLREADRIVSAARRLADHGLPVAVLGDLNSTPSGVVSRRIRAAAGLWRCKPLFVFNGTFPAQLRWPRRIAIDDALVSAGIRVTDWSVLDAAGSDHAPVRIGLRLPEP